MKVTVLGAKVPAAVMSAAFQRILGRLPTQLREQAGRAWGELPIDVRDVEVISLARQLPTPVTLVEVEMTLGGRGQGLAAGRRELPDGPSVDLSSDATDLLHEWLADAPGGAFDEDDAAAELAWELIGEEVTPPDAEPSTLQELWARALIQRLVGEGAIELRGRRLPMAAVVEVLDEPFAATLGRRLLDALVDAVEVEEVFIDAEGLDALAHETKPQCATP